MRLSYLSASVLLILMAFTLKDTSFEKSFLEEYSNLRSSNVETFEQKFDGKKKDYSGLVVSIGSDYYPNTNGYSLRAAQIFEAKPANGISRRSEYFFSSDSVLRVGLFNYFATEDLSQLKSQFSVLEKRLQDYLGDSDEQLNTKETQKDWYTTSRKWNTNGQFNVYLTLTGSNPKRPKRLRLIVYKD